VPAAVRERGWRGCVGAGLPVRPHRRFRDGYQGLGLIAARALEDVHAAIYGRPPQATHGWTEDKAIVVVFRTAWRPEGDPNTQTTASTPLESLQRLVIATVLRRTGETMLPLGWSSNEGRGLAVLAFEHARTRHPTLGLTHRGRETLLGAG
jgi:hypothetical protein